MTDAELAYTKELSLLMTERVFMNPVSAKLLSEDWRKAFPDEVAVAERIKALVEALEKAQSANAAQDDHINQQQDRIDTLEKRNAEMGREVIRLQSLKTVNAALQEAESEFHRGYSCGHKDASLESRTVTVKLPEPFKLAKSSSGLTYYYADEVNEALTAHGIKWEAE